MIKVSLFTMGAAALLAAAIVTPGPAPAFTLPGAPSPLGKSDPRPPQVIPAGKTLLVSGDPETSIPAYTYTAVDPGETFSCRTVCAVSASQLVELGMSANTIYALCLVVDGNYQLCPYNGEVSQEWYYTDSNLAFATNLSPGQHTVQTQVYVTVQSGLHDYYIRYDVLK